MTVVRGMTNPRLAGSCGVSLCAVCCWCRCTCQTSASSCQNWDLMLALIHNDGCFVTSKQSTPEAYYTGGEP